jgi:Acetyltransferase (GNAT) domain
VFHTVAWIETLHRTYGYQPIAFTTSPPGVTLQDGLVVCKASSWIAGRRLISLPFSDHCEPLLKKPSDILVFQSALEQALQRDNLGYVEVRSSQPLAAPTNLWHPSQSYCLHQVDLQPSLAELFRNCQKSSTQRKILRAEREGLTCQTGRSESLLSTFWDLLLATRRRHRIPPQPKRWFRNLLDCCSDAQIRVAWKGELPVASILTLRHKDVLVYKYGCSDARFNNLGGTQLLFWKSIQEGKGEGLRFFDLGRSDWDNTGLLQFKDRWGSTRSSVVYSQFNASPPAESLRFIGMEWMTRLGKRVVPYLPSCLLRLAGSVLYRHIA